MFPVQTVLGTANVSSHFPVSSVRSEALPRPGSYALHSLGSFPVLRSQPTLFCRVGGTPYLQENELEEARPRGRTDEE